MTPRAVPVAGMRRQPRGGRLVRDRVQAVAAERDRLVFTGGIRPVLFSGTDAGPRIPATCGGMAFAWLVAPGSNSRCALK